MFNNIIYLIVVLLIFNMSFPETRVEESAAYAALMHVSGWALLALYGRWGFRRLFREGVRGVPDHGYVAGYQRTVTRLSILAVMLFALDVHFFHLRYWLLRLPGAETFSVIPGILAVAVFFLYLTTIWFWAYGAYCQAHEGAGNRRDFILGNLRLNVPILFPWVVLTLFSDLIGLTPWGEPGRFLGSTEGQMAFFAVFLILLMTFMPRLLQAWWGCEPFPRTSTVRDLEAFFREQGFHYRDILKWPLFQGRMMTAGIMGIVPRYRYILVTEGLMKLLPVEELKAVMAHEMGHAKYRHLLLYVLFFLGYMVLSFGLFDLFFYFLASQPVFAGALKGGSSETSQLFYLCLSFPILLTMILYFRFLMGFFMRHFERQADLFAAVTMGGPAPVIRSLERIAWVSGNIRDLPSWHHFSIRQRVECLEEAATDRGLVRRHNRFLAACFGVYLIGILGLGWFLNFSGVKEHVGYRLTVSALNRQVEKAPGDVKLLRELAMLYHQLDEHEKAIEAYERALSLRSHDPAILNNLAWILVTVPDRALRKPQRALALARMAVALERNAAFLDTLAEAYFVNGLPERALVAIDEAISLARDRKDYYLSQRERFLSGLEASEEGGGGGP